MGNIAESILDAVDILVDKKVSNLSFNKTVRAKIIEITDSSIGQYKVQYQNSYFTAYSSDSSATYQKGSDVYVEILSNDFEKNALIVGTVQRLGSNYISVVEKLDAYTEVGSPLVYAGDVTFNKITTFPDPRLLDIYRVDQSIETPVETGSTQRMAGSSMLAGWKNNDHETILKHNQFKNAVTTAAAQADSIKIGLSIKNDIPVEYRGLGNFGVEITVKYWDASKVESTRDSKTDILTRTYTFDLNQMTGQPYNYIVPTKQYAIFSIDAKNLIQIDRIRLFIKDFPKEAKGKISFSFSNIHVQFLRALTNEELQNSSLKILAPYGAYLGQDNGTSTVLTAQVKIKGKLVNYKTQKIDFYWFRQNNNIITTSAEYSPYGGVGWELLNTLASTTPYEYNIINNDCPGKNNKIKCVGVYSDNGVITILYDTINIINFYNGVDYYITSSTGTNFSFNVGKTQLTCIGGNNTNSSTYIWRQSLNGEPSTQVQSEQGASGGNIYNAIINNPSANFITYTCSIFKDQTCEELLGTTEIVLTNNQQTLGCTLVINNGTQVFKYDEFGTSPTSEYKAAAQRMTIPALSFDIYDKNGQIIKFTGSKNKYMTIRWFWPIDPDVDSEGKVVRDSQGKVLDWNAAVQRKETMLTVDGLNQNFAWEPVSIPDVISGGEIYKFALSGVDILEYNILNKYNAAYANSAASRNNIRLEVDYQGEHLVATTNFTFTKEGELGTNGTGYLARIVPKGRVYILGKTGGFYIDGQKASKTNNITMNISNLFEAQLWNDAIGEIKSGVTIEWSISTNSRRTITIPKQGNVNAHAAKTRLTISGNNVTIDTSKNEECYCDIIQACLIYGGRRYYATYPIPYMERDTSSQPILWLDKGYTEVMYQSDGARGAFDGLPFKAMKIDGANLADIGNTLNTAVKWSSSWGAAARTIPGELLNQRYIDPPSYYVGDANYKSYIKIEYGATGSKTRAYFPIQFYLNRYGMAAMNEWDGQSIEIKNNKGYILAPQMAAGKKEDDNSFTGIAIGQTFQAVEGDRTGVFGYAKGEQTIFLDADTGNAHFGKAKDARIIIATSNYGAAPAGSIYSGDYYSEYNDDGSPKENSENITKKGMLLDLSTPQIRFGSGNFYVTKEGYIHASGGGDIAGWKVGNYNLYSDNQLLYLNSSHEEDSPKIYGQSNSNKKHNTIDSTNSGFYLSGEGLSLGSKFKAEKTGVAYIGEGATKYGGTDTTTNHTYWTIDGNTSSSHISYGTVGKDDQQGVYLGTDSIKLGNKFFANNEGVVKIGDQAVSSTTGKKYWTIDGSTDPETKVSNSYIKYGTSGSKDSVYIGTDKITLGKCFIVNSNGVVKIGNGAVSGTNKHWTIDATGDGETNNSYIRYGERNTDDSVNIATNEISLGKRFQVTSDGIVRLGKGAVAQNGTYWVIMDDGTNSFIRHGLKNDKQSVYIATNEITLGKRFFVNEYGTVRIGNGAVDNINQKHWTIAAGGDAANNNSYISYNTTSGGANDSVYIGTDKLTLGSQFYVSPNGVVRVGKDAVAGSTSSKYWTIDADSANSYVKYGTSGNSNSVYIGTDKLTLGSQFYVSPNGIVRVGKGAVAADANSNYWNITVNNNDNRSYIASGTSGKVPEITNANTAINGTDGTVYLGTDGIRLGTKFAVDNNGNGKFNSLYANGSGQIGGWHIASNALYSNETGTNTAEFTLPTEAQEANLILSTKGAILGPKETLADYKNFSPNHRIWEIGRNGIAYFSDVKISNRPGSDDENIFEWKTNDTNKTTVFKLKDNNCTIGGFNISGNTLSSEGFNITSGIPITATTTPVLDVNEVLKIYGNGDLDVQNITSGASGAFNGTLTGASCTFGSGKIGKCAFGDDGVWASQNPKTGIGSDGYLYLGGNTLSVEEITLPSSGFYIKAQKFQNKQNFSQTIDFGDIDISVSDTVSLSGECSIGTRTGDCTVSGTITLTGTATIGEKTFNVNVPDPYYNFSGQFNRKTISLVKTASQDTTKGSISFGSGDDDE